MQSTNPPDIFSGCIHNSHSLHPENQRLSHSGYKSLWSWVNHTGSPSPFSMILCVRPPPWVATSPGRTGRYRSTFFSVYLDSVVHRHLPPWFAWFVVFSPTHMSVVTPSILASRALSVTPATPVIKKVGFLALTTCLENRSRTTVKVELWP